MVDRSLPFERRDPTNPRLVQRLTPPPPPDPDESRLLLAYGAFSFGGGLKNGGLSDEAMGLLSGIFSFDYMGAAEFEYGAVPTALGYMVEYRNEGKLVRGTIPTASGDVYLIAHEDHFAAAADNIEYWAEFGDYGPGAPGMLKCPTLLKKALVEPRSDYEERFGTRGGLELGCGYFYTIDEEMYSKMMELFEMAPEEAG